MFAESVNRERVDEFYGDPAFEFLDEEERELIESIANSEEWVPMEDGMTLEIDSSFELPSDAVMWTGAKSPVSQRD